MSDECVVDASAICESLLRKDSVGLAVAERINGSTCHAPHLIDAEVGNVLRRHERKGMIGANSAVMSLRLLRTLVDLRYAHDGWLVQDAWALRHTVSFYDALYVALATRLDVPLLTADEKLSRAPGLPCRVDLIV
ncbi:PIN domain-containing protein [Nocardia puris]|uniref:Ribonuclease VapC n=1 Tax=Nocardia puris TaxID=208602 RepID=A0A366DYN9_9NOCA|nr:type II toxin-antitoxin system VapC family toxin [Nocardia puris]MBF6209949.1 PIN domain-containing protein [Nocardia puris]MBF6368141.1 PIN domain-containing protein [Nocardia puris]MBF6458140.1 PIN domain-containing protein [Nocardia puris]RBO94308.1 putative nucleic acid-binding protein [Nocardia puris]